MKDHIKKSNKATLLKRVSEVASLLINGYNREDIIQYSSKNFRVCERQTDKYIQEAKEIIANSVNKNVAYDFGKSVRRFEELYKKAIDNKDIRTALAVNKELATLQNLYKTQVELSGEIKFISSIPD